MGVPQYRVLLQRVRTIENVKASRLAYKRSFHFTSLSSLFSPETRRVLETLFEFHCLLHNSILDLTFSPETLHMSHTRQKSRCCLSVTSAMFVSQVRAPLVTRLQVSLNLAPVVRFETTCDPIMHNHA